MKQLLTRLFHLSLSPTAKNTYVLFAGNLTDAVFAFFFTVLTFRWLSTADFGIFSAINNFIIVIYSLLDMGVGSSQINFISYHLARGHTAVARKYLQTGFTVRLLVTSAVVIAVLAFSWLIAPRLFLVSQPLLVVLAGVAILGLSLLEHNFYAFQAHQRFFSSAFTSLSFSAIRLLQLGAVYLFNLPYHLITAVAITAIAPLAGAFLPLRRFRLSLAAKFPDPSILKNLLKFGGWMGGVRLFSAVAGRLDVQMMLLLAGASAAGIYSVAARLASFYSLIISSFTAVLAPKFAVGRPLSQMKPFLAKSLLFLGGLLVAMLLGVAIARPFILLLFGTKAAASVLPFQALTLAFIPFMASTLATTVIIYNLKRPKVLGLLSLFQLVAVFVGYLVFIPRFGSLGPALTLGLTNTIVMIISYWYVFTKWR